jgi:hypothetical protein
MRISLNCERSKTCLYVVGFEVLTPVVMKSAIFWDITACSPLKVNISEEHVTWFFDPEDGGDMFLRNVGWLSTDYTPLYPRTEKSSCLCVNWSSSCMKNYSAEMYNAGFSVFPTAVVNLFDLLAR